MDETGKEGRAVGRCEVLNGTGELVGGVGERLDGWIRRWLYPAVRHQVGLGRMSTSPIFAEPFGDLLLVCWVVMVHVAGDGFWGSHTRHVPLSLPQLSIFSRWCLLCAVSYAASTRDPGGGHFSDDPSSYALSLTTLIRFCSQAFLPSCCTPGNSFHGRFSHA